MVHPHDDERDEPCETRGDALILAVLAVVWVPAAIAALARGRLFESDPATGLVLLMTFVACLFGGICRWHGQVRLAVARARRRAG
jgi:hypothetical protein